MEPGQEIVKAPVGEVVYSPQRTNAEKVKALIPEGEVYKLDQSKVYVIVVRKEILSMQAVSHLCQILKTAGIKACVMSYVGGPIKDGVQIMEQH